MPQDDGAPRARSRRFPTTQWSLVTAAADSRSSESCEALAALCSAYWYPVYAQVRQSGSDPDSAQDLTQGFFLQLLEKRTLKLASPDRGSLRAFLKASVRNYVSNERRRTKAEKRGGGKRPIELDFQAAEARFKREPVERQTPDRIFERRWARALLSRTLERFREEVPRRADVERYRRLEPFLVRRSAGYRELAADLGTSEATIKTTVRRMRQRFGRLLREEVGRTVEDPEGVDREIRFLFAALDG